MPWLVAKLLAPAPQTPGPNPPTAKSQPLDPNLELVRTPSSALPRYYSASHLVSATPRCRFNAGSTDNISVVVAVIRPWLVD